MLQPELGLIIGVGKFIHYRSDRFNTPDCFIRNNTHDDPKSSDGKYLTTVHAQKTIIMPSMVIKTGCWIITAEFKQLSKIKPNLISAQGVKIETWKT